MLGITNIWQCFCVLALCSIEPITGRAWESWGRGGVELLRVTWGKRPPKQGILFLSEYSGCKLLQLENYE